MALSDYRLCDVCGGKAFYDQRLSYWDKGEVSTAPYRIAGKEQIADPKQNDEYGMRLDHLGDWAVVCEGCAETHETSIRPRAALAAAQAEQAKPVASGVTDDAADAKRYRWLRARPLADDEIYIAVDSPRHPSRWGLGGNDPAGCDAAIDAAIAAAPEAPKP